MVTFDVISNLNLTKSEKFSWKDKSSGIYCIIAGNISNDMQIVFTVLDTLSSHYESIFYVPGTLEYETAIDINDRTEELQAICKYMNNVTMLRGNIATLAGIAVIGINGWIRISSDVYDYPNVQRLVDRDDEFNYLCKTVEKLQIHKDIRKIIIVISSVPNNELFFGTEEISGDYLDFTECRNFDTEKKVSHWVFGHHETTVDIILDNIHFINGSKDQSVFLKVEA